jgi:hypothetical protein
MIDFWGKLFFKFLENLAKKLGQKFAPKLMDTPLSISRLHKAETQKTHPIIK